MADSSINQCRIMQADILSGTNGQREAPLHCMLHLYPDINLVDIMPLLERESLEINKTNCNGNTALHVAVTNPSVKLEVINEFLQRGANPNFLNNLWDTPLHVAVANHLGIDVIQTLLEHMDRSNVDLPNKMDRTPLGTAVRECSLDTAKELIRFGAEINRHNYAGETILHTAKVTDSPEMIKMILQLGADIRVSDRAGNSPLHAAAGQTHEQTVKILLKNGALVNRTNNEGMTPLHFLDWKVRFSAPIVNLLVKYGADCCARDRQQRKPMYYAAKACSQFTSLDSLKMLILHTLFQTGGEDGDIKEDLLHIRSSRQQGSLSRYIKTCKRELALMQNVILCEGISLYDVIARKLQIDEVIPARHAGYKDILSAVLRELCSNRYPRYHHVMLNRIQKEWLIKVAMALEVYTVMKRFTPGRKRFRASLNHDTLEMVSAHLTNRELVQFIQAFSTPY